MKEVTTIITVEITDIKKSKDEQLDKITSHTPEELRELEDAMKEVFCVDDVKVAKVQYFVMDKAGGEE